MPLGTPSSAGAEPDGRAKSTRTPAASHAERPLQFAPIAKNYCTATWGRGYPTTLAEVWRSFDAVLGADLRVRFNVSA